MTLAPTLRNLTPQTPITPFPTESDSIGTQAPTLSPRPQTPFPTWIPTEAESLPSEESSVSTTTPPPSMSANASSPPVASPDSASVSSEDDMVFVPVLDNDTPALEQTLKVNSIATQASNGSCSISVDLQEVVYEPNPGFTGFDSCVYEACDSVPSCDTATLTVIVVGK